MNISSRTTVDGYNFARYNFGFEFLLWTKSACLSGEVERKCGACIWCQPMERTMSHWTSPLHHHCLSSDSVSRLSSSVVHTRTHLSATSFSDVVIDSGVEGLKVGGAVIFVKSRNFPTDSCKFPTMGDYVCSKFQLSR